MIPTMVMLAYVWQGSEDPVHASFWFRMSLASLIGGFVACPVNYWLVSNHLKHGCVTLPGAAGPYQTLCHRSSEASMVMTGNGPGHGAW